MKKRKNPDGSVTVQAWWMTKAGTSGTTVYDQETAVKWFGDGYDMQIVAITRFPNGDRKIEKGVVI